MVTYPAQSNIAAKSNRKRSSGQATVELALVLTLLALLLAGVADVARIFSEHLAVVNAAGVAARWSVLEPANKACSYPSPFSNEEDVVRADLGPKLAAQLTAVSTSAGSDPDSVTVRVTYGHTFLFGLLQNVPASFTGSATMPGVVTIPGPICFSTPLPTSTPAPSPTSLPTSTPTSTSTPSVTVTQVPPTQTTTRTPSVTVTQVPPTQTTTRTPTNLPTSTATNPPTNTPAPTLTPTATPTARLIITTLVANKQNGNNTVNIKVTVTDGAVGQDNVALSATVNGNAATGTWLYLGNGVYQLCPSDNKHGGNGPTVAVTASKAGYQSASGSVTAANVSGCPPNPP